MKLWLHFHRALYSFEQAAHRIEACRCGARRTIRKNPTVTGRVPHGWPVPVDQGSRADRWSSGWVPEPPAGWPLPTRGPSGPSSQSRSRDCQ